MSTETDAVSNEAGTPLLNVTKRHRGYESPSDLYIIKQSKRIDVCGPVVKDAPLKVKLYCVICVTLGHMQYVRV